MSSAGDLVARLAREGIDSSLLADVAEALFAGELERKALAERRQHERERKAKSRDKTGQHGKPQERRGPPIDNNHTPSSEANASGGSPPADPIKQVFDLGVAVLTSTGTPEKQARSLIGKWCKGGKEAQVLQALIEARSKANPIEWLNARLRVAKWVSESGYEYRGDERSILREAEKRADWNTYWRVKSAIERAA